MVKSEAMSVEGLLEELTPRVGEVVHLSDWLEISQSRINEFAAATDDQQWLHVNPARARDESPFGETIAHGYLVLSLYPYLRNLVDVEHPAFPGVQTVINYGTNKVRFPNAVRSGARVRGHFELTSVKQVKDSIELIEKFTVEVENESRPACVAEVIMRLYGV